MYSNLMSMKMATLVSSGNLDTHSSVIFIALTYSSYEHVKSYPLRLMLSTTVGFSGSLVVTTTAMPPDVSRVVDVDIVDSIYISGPF